MCISAEETETKNSSERKYWRKSFDVEKIKHISQMATGIKRVIPSSQRKPRVLQASVAGVDSSDLWLKWNFLFYCGGFHGPILFWGFLCRSSMSFSHCHSSLYCSEHFQQLFRSINGRVIVWASPFAGRCYADYALIECANIHPLYVSFHCLIGVGIL